MRRVHTAALASFLALCGCHAGSATCTTSSTPGTSAWTTSVVVGGIGAANPFGTSTSLAADDAGHVAITFGDDLLHLARFDANIGWTVRTFSLFGTGFEDGFGSTVRFDTAGEPVVALSHRTGPSSAQVRFGDGSIAIMPTGNEAVTELAMALDAAGRPRIVFDRTVSGLGYGTWDGTSWQIESIDHDASTDPFVGIEVALALDAAGRPWVAHATLDFKLQVAHRDDDGAWQLETLEVPDGSQGHSPSLAIDSQGRVHLVWIDGRSATLHYALHDAGGWRGESVGCADKVGHVALALGADDLPQITFAAPTTGSGGQPHAVAPLEYAVRGSGGWAIERVGADGESDTWSSLVIGGDGVARVSWYDFTSGSVRYAERRN